MIVKLKDLCDNVPMTHLKNGWFPARPLNWQCRTIKQRLSEAWLVFIGKADPFVWPEDETIDNDQDHEPT